LLLITVPLFFEIYRTSVFNTVSRDDYAPYLLFFLGEGGIAPPAPFGYRILSISLAIPFYYALPLYTFRYVRESNVPYLKATEALSMVSYLSIVLTAVLVYKIAHRRFQASRVSALTVGLLALLLTGFIGRAGVDATAVLLISLLVYYQDEAAVFVALILLAPGVNEKIPILFGSLLMARVIVSSRGSSRMLSRPVGRAPLLATLGSLVLYALLRAYIRLPGHDEQTSISAAWPSLRATIGNALSFKGLVLIVLPAVVLVLIVLLAIESNRHADGRGWYFPLVDTSGFVVLVAIAAVTNLSFNGGRVVMHAFPLYLPAVARYLDAALATAETRRS
jgi:hypothetical protein